MADFTGTLDTYGMFPDVRDIARVEFDLTSEYQTVLEGEKGKTRMFSPTSGDSVTPFAVIANFDSIDHTVETRLSDGVNTFQLPQTADVPIAAGVCGPLLIGQPPALLEGWSLQMRVTVDPAVRPCRAILGYTDTNLSPVRTDQGGAF